MSLRMYPGRKEDSEGPAWWSKRPRSEREHGESEGPDEVAHATAARRPRCSRNRHFEEGAGIRPFLSHSSLVLQSFITVRLSEPFGGQFRGNAPLHVCVRSLHRLSSRCAGRGDTLFPGRASRCLSTASPLKEIDDFVQMGVDALGERATGLHLIVVLLHKAFKVLLRSPLCIVDDAGTVCASV